MATQLAAGERERLNEVFGSFIDETIGIVARQTRDTVSFAVGSPAREALELVVADDLAATVIRRERGRAAGDRPGVPRLPASRRRGGRGVAGLLERALRVPQSRGARARGAGRP